MQDLPALLKRAIEITDASSEAPWYIDLTTSSVDFIGSEKGVKIYNHHYSGYLKRHPDTEAIVAWRALAKPLLEVADAASELSQHFSVSGSYTIRGGIAGGKTKTVSITDLSKVLADALARLAEVKLP